MDQTQHAYWDYHLHNLILNGIHAAGQSPYYDDVKNSSAHRFKRFAFRFDGQRYDTAQRREMDTPYMWKDDLLFYEGARVDDLPLEAINESDDVWGSEKSWYFKEMAGLSEFYELRLNPVNACANIRCKTGFKKEFRGCVFCQRCYPYMRHSENREIVKPSEIFAEIFRQYGSEVVEKIRKAILVTGDTKTGRQMLELAESIFYEHLIPNHFRGTFSVVTTVIRDEEHIRRLSNMDNTIFEFPIECFSRRGEILGEAKGIPLTEVGEILSTARRYFKYIRVNYLIGLDDLESADEGFRYLTERRLIDDVIANIFMPFTEEVMMFRQPQANSIQFLHAYRDLFAKYGLSPKRTGATKSLFCHFDKADMGDELIGAGLEKEM